MDLKIATNTDRGRVREMNEDSVLADAPLVAVADGMGGHKGGEVASSMAIEVVKRWKDQLEGHSGREAMQLLGDAFREAHRVVFTKGQEDDSLTGMGTTLTAGWIDGDTLSLAHVGDSRAYLLRGGKLQQLTEDQNVAQEWVRRGRISAEEAASSPQRHVILQAVGADPDKLDVDTTSLSLRPGDRLLLATDGLFGMLKSADRLRDLLVSDSDPDVVARALIDAANDAGGEDNISVVIVDVAGDPDAVLEGDPHAPVVMERGEQSEVKRASTRRIPRSVIVALGVAALLAVMFFVLIRPNASTYVVAARGQKVVVLKGHPGRTEEDPATGKVVKVFRDVKTDQFPSTTRRDLVAGIPVESIAQAERVVKRLPRELSAVGTPTPKPSQEASPSPSVKLTLPPKTASP